MFYADGIHDDTQEIQQLLDSGLSVVELPATEHCYLISKTLKIHSGQTFKLGRTTRIKLMDQSNCMMMTNAEVGEAHDIALEGGIWDFNNLNQLPNPWLGDHKPTPWHSDGKADTVVKFTDGYLGNIMRFEGVQRLTIKDCVMKDPVTYCIQLGDVWYFTVENIQFDMNYGNPQPINMDGVHIDGGCRFGLIRNIQGTCYDDVVALNANDNHDGPIEDIQVDGVFAEHALRGVRLLSTKSPVRNISIQNIFGTYYQNGIIIGYFYPFSGIRGIFENITLRNIYPSNAPRLPVYRKKPQYSFAMLHIDGEVDINALQVDGMRRREECGNIEMIYVGKESKIHTLSLEHISQENLTGEHFPMIRNEGHIDKLYMQDIDSGTEEKFYNSGTITSTFCTE